MNIKKSVTELIGSTPLLELVRYKKEKGFYATVIGKLESFNPAGSVKDRVAKAMIEDAEQNGTLKKGSVIIEPTSGNTGIGLASVGTAKGYRVILTMPETMSLERRNLLKAYGAEIVLTEGPKGMRGAVEKAEELLAQTPGAVILGQFDNPANPLVHEKTTGPEIWADTEGDVDIFVAGIGTGGTITGIGHYLKQQNPNIQIIAVEPKDSPLLSEGKAGSHKIQGIGANFVPTVLDKSVYDEVVAVTNEEAFEATRVLAAIEGILVGISSGGALAAAAKLAGREENRDKKIVVLLPDTGERYLSTGVFKKD